MLKDLTARFVATLVPQALARVMVYGVALSYTLCLLANFVLKVRGEKVGHKARRVYTVVWRWAGSKCKYTLCLLANCVLTVLVVGSQPEGCSAVALLAASQKGVVML